MFDEVFPAATASSTAAAADKMKHAADGKRILKQEFPKDSMVMIIDQHCTMKMQPKYTGLFKVLHKNHGGSYVLMDTLGSLHPTNVPPSHIKLINQSND